MRLLEGVRRKQQVAPRGTGGKWEDGEVSTYRRGHSKGRDKAKVTAPDETRGWPIVPKTRKKRAVTSIVHVKRHHRKQIHS